MSEIQKQELTSMNITEEQLRKLKELFPEAFTEGLKVDWDKLRLTLGQSIDVGKERYGMNWPGKADCFKTIQQPSIATLIPARNESVDFDTTENLFIEGDNLEVLKLLQKSYLGKVKMIYIDPPYNTGNEFIYPDNYSESLETYLEYTGQIDSEGRKFGTNTDTDGRFHSKWLNMMYPRLFLAKNLLSENGVVFISIDHNEIGNLLSLCNEIFGEENLIGLLSIENNPKGRKNSKFISISNDYCLIYARNKEKSYFVENIPKGAADMIEDEEGNFIHSSGKRVLVGENDFNKEVKELTSEKHYSVYYNSGNKDLKIIKENEVESSNKELIISGYERYISTNSNGIYVENTYTSSKLEDLFKENALEFKNGKIYEKNFSSSIRMKSLIVNKEYEALVNGNKINFKLDVKTTSAGTLLKEIFNTKEPIFTAPKNIGLIKLFATLFDSKDFISLDFFSGSATTAHAILELNKSDNGKRKFICIQLPEPTVDKSEAFKLGYKTITEIGKERIRRAIKKIKENDLKSSELFKADFSNIDLGFKVFKLSKSNFKIWDSALENEPEVIQAKLFEHIQHISPEAEQEAILFELLLKSGFELTTPIEKLTLAGLTVFSIAEGQLLICLEKELTHDCIKAMAEMQPTRVICLDEGFKGENADALKTNAVQIMKSKGVVNFRTV